MSSKISTSDIRNVHIYNGRTDSYELDLCRKHRSELSNVIADKLDQLVSTKLFQNYFREFLPGPDEEVRVRIQITDRHIVVQEIDKNGCGFGHSQKVKLNEILDLEKTEIGEAERINQSILQKANQIYQDHLSESDHRDRSVSPLHGRTEKHESTRHRGRSLSPPDTERRRPTREASLPPERHNHRTTKRDAMHGRRREKRHAPKHRSGHQQTNHVPARTLESELDLHESKRNSVIGKTRTNSSFNSERLAPIDQRLKKLENKLGASSSTNISSQHAERQVQALEERLRTIESKVGALSLEAPKPTSSPELELLKIQKRDLESQLGALNNENELLKMHLPKLTSSISSENFDAMTQLSQALAGRDLSGSTHFPGELKEKFMNLPEPLRHAIYYHTYLLVDPTQAQDPWPIGQTLFEGAEGPDSAANLCRSHAIRHFLLQSLSVDFASAVDKFPPSELSRRFAQIPEEDKNAIYTQLEYIQPKGDDYKGPAHAFAGVDRLSVTNQERGIAIDRAILDRIAEYHRHHYREGIKMIERTFQEVLERLKDQLKESEITRLSLQRQLQEATGNI